MPFADYFHGPRQGGHQSVIFEEGSRDDRIFDKLLMNLPDIRSSTVRIDNIQLF